jgi:hypothetical protein
LFQESTAISAHILPMELQLSLSNARRWIFLFMEHCSCPLAVEFILGKQENTATSAPILPRERELSLLHAQRCSFLIMEQCCGPLAVEMIPEKHCDFSTYLTKRARTHSGACTDLQFPDYGTVLWSLGSRNISRKALRFQHLLQRERELSLAYAQRCNFLIMEQCSGPLAVEIFPGEKESTAISAPILPRERELILLHAQRCSFLIMEQCCGPRSVEIIPGKHCDISTYLAKRARAQSGACAEVQFPDYGTVLWSAGSRNYSRKTLRFQHLSYLES